MFLSVSNSICMSLRVCRGTVLCEAQGELASMTWSTGEEEAEEEGEEEVGFAQKAEIVPLHTSGHRNSRSATR